MIGKVHSIFTGGTVDGPGIRFVLFLKGCPLRCLYCHNPDTWTMENATEYTVEEMTSEVLKYKGYFANGGGITVSGGEPLFQIDFVIALFQELKKKGIHTACDTSGIIFDKNNASLMKKMDALLEVTDLFLLDIKHIDSKKHKELTGADNLPVLEFAEYLSNKNKKMWIRHVLVPTITLDEKYLIKLRDFIFTLKTVEKIEVLPYHTMGKTKYDQLGISYPLEGILPPTKEEIKFAKDILGGIHDTK